MHDPVVPHEAAERVARRELIACPMGAMLRDICMQDPRRLEHWPANCSACNEKTRARTRQFG